MNDRLITNIIMDYEVRSYGLLKIFDRKFFLKYDKYWNCNKDNLIKLKLILKKYIYRYEEGVIASALTKN